MKLKAVGERMIEQGWKPPTNWKDKAKKREHARRVLARGSVNARVGRIERMLRWGLENDLVPGRRLPGVPRGRRREVRPLEGRRDGAGAAGPPRRHRGSGALRGAAGRGDDHLQLLSAVRPGEVVLIRGRALERTGDSCAGVL
jgi:hypothetical protein